MAKVRHKTAKVGEALASSSQLLAVLLHLFNRNR